MERIFKRIAGLEHIAEKKLLKGSVIDQIVGRQVMRNLKMVKKIIHGSITQCGQCRYWKEGACGLANYPTTQSDYCSKAAKRERLDCK